MISIDRSSNSIKAVGWQNWLLERLYMGIGLRALPDATIVVALCSWYSAVLRPIENQSGPSQKFDSLPPRGATRDGNIGSSRFRHLQDRASGTALMVLEIVGDAIGTEVGQAKLATWAHEKTSHHLCEPNSSGSRSAAQDPHGFATHCLSSICESFPC